MEVGADGLGPDDLRLTFDPAPNDASTRYATDHIVVHPDWFTAGPCLGNSKHLCLASPAEDIALVFLAEPVAGVDPSPSPDLTSTRWTWETRRSRWSGTAWTASSPGACWRTTP